jgi:hypothetical protein
MGQSPTRATLHARPPHHDSSYQHPAQESGDTSRAARTRTHIPAVSWAFPLASAWKVPETFHMKRTHTSGISSVPSGISMEGSRNIPDETSARRCIPKVSLKFPLASASKVPDETSANYGIHILSRTIGGKLGQPHSEFHGNKLSRDNYSMVD